MKKKLICDIHIEALSILEGIREDYMNPNLLGSIDTVIDLIEQARECGQTMEDRLIEYRGAIQSLGFCRVRDFDIPASTTKGGRT